MAKIMAGVGCSHVPAIGVAMDTGITHEEYWKPVFEGFKKSREWSLKNITQEHLDEGILGIISSIDKPLSPFGEAMSDFSMNIDRKNIKTSFIKKFSCKLPKSY